MMARTKTAAPKHVKQEKASAKGRKSSTGGKKKAKAPATQGVKIKKARRWRLGVCWLHAVVPYSMNACVRA